MIAEKINTVQRIIGQISASCGKADFISDELIVSGMKFLEEHSIPDNKHEEYKYCNLGGVFRKEFSQLTQEFTRPAEIKTHRIEGAINLFIVNGKFEPELSDSLPEGISISKFSALEKRHRELPGSLSFPYADVFTALSSVYSPDGMFLHFQAKLKPGKPVHLIYISSASSESFLQIRNFCLLEENTEVELLESQVSGSTGKIFTNYLSEKMLKRDARLNSVMIQHEGQKNYGVNNTKVSIEGGAAYFNTTITTGGQLVRNNHEAILKGRDAEAHLNGFFIATGNSLVDNHTLMDHRVADCMSNELYKGIARDKSTGVFNGKIFVRRDAQKTNAYQSSKNILLSDEASIFTKPQLEIYANDVKCSHGTSTGKLDENALFYLNSRGIGKEKARKMLLRSFAEEVFATIRSEMIRDLVAAAVSARI
jgi:Fe-S cluster assembly protein SufD